MIVYNPLDGDAIQSPISLNTCHCFLATPLGSSVPQDVRHIRTKIESVCKTFDYKIIDANSEITGKDFLLKIWKLIASSPLLIGICHKDTSEITQANIYYEIGVAQALGRETLLVKSPKTKIPSNFKRTEHVEFNSEFRCNLTSYISSLKKQAEHYETVAEQLERNPVLALDYLKRAFLITGNKKLRKKAQDLVKKSGLENRAKNSVELLAASF